MDQDASKINADPKSYYGTYKSGLRIRIRFRSCIDKKAGIRISAETNADPLHCYKYTIYYKMHNCLSLSIYQQI
jgi:hypothetical protein